MVVPITYVTSGAWGAGSGGPLPAATIDANFFALQDALNSLLGTIGSLTPVSISTITSPTPGTIAITLTNGQVFGPFTMPAATLNFVGAWAPNTSYSTNDIFTAAGAVYIVRENIVSAATFDPSAADGSGNAVYGLLLASAGNVLPAGGSTDQVLAKHSSTSYDVVWVDPAIGVPAGGSTGQALVKNSGTDFDDGWATIAGMPTGGGTGQVLTKTSGTDFAASWKTPNAAVVNSSLGSTGTLSWNPVTSTLLKLTPTGNITLNAGVSGVAGNIATIVVLTSGISSFNITLGSGFKSQGVLATGTADAMTFTMQFISDGTNWNELSRTTAM